MAYRREWFNDDDFWKRYAPVIFDENRMAEASTVADGVTRLAAHPLLTFAAALAALPWSWLAEALLPLG